MFKNKNCSVEIEKVTLEYDGNIKTLKLDQELEIKDLKKTHELALKDKEQELRHFANEEIKKLKDEVVTVQRENAVLKKENEMMNKITEINADIVDVKSLVNKLIEKLPSINLNSLTVQSNGNSDNR